MNKELSKRRIVPAIAAGVVAMSLVGVGAYMATPISTTVHASIEETTDTLKVFVGDVDNAPEGYAQQRAAYVECAADTNDSTEMEAVIGLNDYYTVDAVVAWAEDYDITINRAYMWPEGETGRLALYVENNDIETSMETYKQQIEESGLCEDDPTFAADHQRFLDGEYEVFALTVTASAEALEALNTESDCVSYVDVMYNTEAETYAARVDKIVSYIELPSKPDGAL